MVRDPHGAPIDARVRIEAESVLGRLSSALGSRFSVTRIAVRGHARVRLEAGAYRIVATRGGEWSIAERSVDVRDGTDVELTLRHVVDPGPYVASDFHVHTDASGDGRVSYTMRLASMRAEGLGVAAITDHNHVTQGAPDNAGMLLLPGVELTTWAPEVGHFNVFPATAAPRHGGRTPDAIFREAHAARSLVQVNHPRLDGHIAYFDLAGFDGRRTTREGFGLDFDVLEVWNGYDLGHPDELWSIFREWLGLVALGHRITAVGNSDSHDVDRTWVGYPRTYLDLGEGEPTEDDVIAALDEGRAFVTTGPVLDVRVGLAGPGDSIARPRSGHVRLRVRVLAPTSMDVDRVDVFLDARHARSIPIPKGNSSMRLDRVLDVAVGRARTIVVTVRGDTPMRTLLPTRPVLPAAFTNPIRIEPAPRTRDRARLAQR